MSEGLTPQREAADGAVASLVNGGYAPQIAKEIVSRVRAEAAEEARTAAAAELAAVRAERDQTQSQLAAKRDEIADDIHRAELPVFAETENPVLVAKTVRAIDVRLADCGPGAPYWVARAGERS